MTGYRRDAATWTAFGALFAFGVANAALGPALPYLRSAEHLSYVAGALHLAAFAVGGLSAGLLAAARPGASRRRAVVGGLVLAALGGLGVGYGPGPLVTVTAALLLSFSATTALIRIWAALADAHRAHRAVAMTEGEVSVSLAGVLTPLLFGGLAATALSWRSSFAVAAVLLVLAAAAAARGMVDSTPEPVVPDVAPGRRSWLSLLLILAVVALEFTLSFWAATYLHDDVGLARDTAVTAVSGLYAAALAGRLLASRLARSVDPGRLLAGALVTALVAMPILLTARGAPAAVVGLVLAGAGIGATFPLASSVHVGASARPADAALGEILVAAGVGQIVAPVVAGVVAQAAGLRIGLLTLPALIVVAGVALAGSARR